MRGFLNFIREQGVVGLAVGFLMGGAVSKVVSSLVTDILNPLLNIVIGVGGNFKEATFTLGGATIMWGSFVANLIDFAVIAAVIYYGVKGLRLHNLDKPKEKKKDK
jgi:large conductance mechanosensitive channel